MRSLSRRMLLRHGTAISLSAMAYTSLARAASGKSLPKVAFIGCGGRSHSLAKDFANDAAVSWACDPDQKRVAEFQASFGAAQVTGDLRRVLDDRSVDAVVVATPDHWHAPASIMACEAGKHVYVEKPCSHNIREGQWLVDAARRNQVVVQHGTQSRTNPLVVNAIHLLREGVIGDVLVCKAWNVQRRRNIGRAQPTPPPGHVDYDTWVGPAEFVPFQSNRFHYDWHWWYNFGTGDIGNDGTHELDIARWGLDVSGLPATASAMGGKFYFDDDQQFPDTATCVFQWPSNQPARNQRQLVFEMRIWSKNLPHHCDTGIEFYGTEGMLFVSKRGKLEAWDESNQPIPIPAAQASHDLPKNHAYDFLESIASQRKPAAEIAIGHDSCCLVHLANISLRTGRTLHLDQSSRTIKDDAEANEQLGRRYRSGGHWSAPKF